MSYPREPRTPEPPASPALRREAVAAHLSSSELFAQFREAFEASTGLGLELMAPGDFRASRRRGVPEFCRMLQLTQKTCDACRETHARQQLAAMDCGHTSECFAGMASSSVPVKVKGRTVAYLQTGHVFLGGKNIRQWEVLRRFVARHGLDPESCRNALEAVRIVDPSKYEAAVRLLEIFARQLPDAVARHEVPYPAVEQAVRMVGESIEREWTLSGLARQLNMNPSYLSEMFRKATGQTFTGYLAALRVDKSCRLLASTHLTASEIAFSSGFRSISQFNRVFKSSTGMSPSQYRRSCNFRAAAA